MKNAFFLFALLPLVLLAQNKNHAPIVGLYCSDLINNSRWCFTFDSSGKVKAQLSDRTTKTVAEDFLPGEFSDEFTVINDTIYFRSYLEDFGAKEYPVDYRYNYFNVVLKANEVELFVEGKNSSGEKREKRLILRKIK